VDDDTEDGKKKDCSAGRSRQTGGTCMQEGKKEKRKRNFYGERSCLGTEL
jgi:hypothetical protein